MYWKHWVHLLEIKECAGVLVKWNWGPESGLGICGLGLRECLTLSLLAKTLLLWRWATLQCIPQLLSCPVRSCSSRPDAEARSLLLRCMNPVLLDPAAHETRDIFPDVEARSLLFLHLNRGDGLEITLQGRK